MSVFANLKTLVGDNKEALAEIGKIETNYNTLSQEVSTFEAKLNDIKQSRDKYKAKLAAFKKNLGFEEGEEISEEKISEKLGKVKGEVKQEASEVEKQLRAEIAQLEKTIEELKGTYETKIQEKDKTVLEKQIDLELYKTSSDLNTINKKAHEIVLKELKKGLSFEEGKLVYKNEDGTTLRKNGVAMSLKEKLEEIKSSEDYSFLFKSEAQSGSGLKTGNAATYRKTGSAGERLRQIAAKKGITLNV
jgi:chromosome segregation ATPase